MSIGAEWAGLELALAIEKDKHATETYRANHPGTKVLEDDIRNIDPRDYIKGSQLPTRRRERCQMKTILFLRNS